MQTLMNLWPTGSDWPLSPSIMAFQEGGQGPGIDDAKRRRAAGSKPTHGQGSPKPCNHSTQTLRNVSREMRGRMDGFALLGNYSKAKQTHEVSCLEPVETNVQIIRSLHFRLCCMHCSICIDCFNASPHAQSVDVRTSPSVTVSTATTLTKKAVMTAIIGEHHCRKACQSQRCSILRCQADWTTTLSCLAKNTGVTDTSLVGTAGHLTIQRSCP